MESDAGILIVDDDPEVRRTLSDILRLKGFSVAAVDGGQPAIETAKEMELAVALIDLKLEDTPGLDVLRQLKDLCPSTECIVLTGYADKESAIKAINLGAYGYLEKPYDLEHLLLTLRRAIEKRAANAELSKRSSRLELLNDIGRRIAAELELEGVLEQTVRLVHESFGYDHVSLFTLEEDDEELVMRANAGSFAHLVPSGYRVRLDQGMVGWVCKHGERLLANDVRAEPHFINLFPAALPTLAELSVPIRVGEKTSGVLDVQSSKLNTFDPNDVVMLETLADQVASAIENAQLYEALQRELAERMGVEREIRQKTDDLALINALNSAANRGDSFGDVLDLMEKEVARIFSSGMASIFLLSEKRDYLVVQNFCLQPAMLRAIEKLIRRRIPEIRNPLRKDSLHNEVMETGEARLINDPEAIGSLLEEYAEAADFPERVHRRVVKLLPQIKRMLGFHSVILAPLGSEGKAVGLMHVSRAEPFADSDLQRLAGIAEQLTVIIRRKQAEEELAKHTQRLEGMVEQRTRELQASQDRTIRSHRLLLALSQAAQVVQRARTPAEVYRTVGDEVVRLGHNAAIFTLTDGGSRLAISYMSFEPVILQDVERLAGFSTENFRGLLPPGGSFHWILTANETLFHANASQIMAEMLPDVLRPFAGRFAALLGFEQAIASPLIVGGEPYGVLAVAGSGLTEADVPAIATFARQTAIALDNARLYQEAQIRTEELEAANEELEGFSYAVSHDLRAPLRAISGFSRILLEEHSADLPLEAGRYLRLVNDNTHQMGELIDNLLAFSRLSRQPLSKQMVQPAELVRRALEDLRAESDGRRVEVSVGNLPSVEADPALLRQVFINLLGNALKFTRKREQALIQVGCMENDGKKAFFVKDNGVGFDMQYADKLFGVFQRLHRAEDFEGTGVGLATVQRIIHRHGGRIWAEAEVDHGAVFYFTI